LRPHKVTDFKKNIFIFVDWFVAPHFAATGGLVAVRCTKFADEPACLLANIIWNETIPILSLYKKTLLAPVGDVLTYPLKLFCRNISNFP
jgi:hypothetical protein